MITRKLKVCQMDQVPVGRTVSFRYGVSNGIAYNDGGTIKAYVNRCTHMGGSVSLVPGQCLFRCSWHHAEFDPKTGVRTAGQAPEGTMLKPVPLEISGNDVWAILEIEDEFE